MRRISIALGALLAGCSLQPEYQRPEMELPQEWKEAAPPQAYPGAEDGRWWRVFQDPALEATV